MSKVSHRTNGKKYDKRNKERKGCGEVLYDDGILIPACDIKFKRRADRRRVRHTRIEFDD